MQSNNHINDMNYEKLSAGANTDANVSTDKGKKSRDLANKNFDN